MWSARDIDKHLNMCSQEFTLLRLLIRRNIFQVKTCSQKKAVKVCMFRMFDGWWTVLRTLQIGYCQSAGN